MEGLILLLAEILALPVSLGLTVLADILALAVDAVVELIMWIAGRRSRRREEASPTTPPSKRRPIAWKKWKRVTRGVAIAGSALLALMLVAVLIVNWLFLDALIRWQLAGVEKKAGIAVTFDSADGNLLAGVVELRDVTFTRSDHEVSQFELSADSFRIDLAVMKLLYARAVFEQVDVHRLRGTYQRMGLPEELRTPRTFRLDRLEVTDVKIEVADHTRPRKVVKAQLQIDSLVSEPLRSDWAVFDVLFRSNAQGRINGQPFSIASGEVSGGRQTRWMGEGLPIELIAPYVGGPLDWITTGKLDVDVTDRWQLGEETEIEMHWQVVLRDIKAEVPADASATTRLVAKPVVAMLNKHAVRLPLEFDLVIDRNRFQFAASPDAVELGRAIGDGLASAVGKLAGLKPQAVKKAAADRWNRFKKLLDKPRKGQGD